VTGEWRIVAAELLKHAAGRSGLPARPLEIVVEIETIGSSSSGGLEDLRDDDRGVRRFGRVSRHCAAFRIKYRRIWIAWTDRPSLLLKRLSGGLFVAVIAESSDASQRLNLFPLFA
jgi:hypothetical protein